MGGPSPPLFFGYKVWDSSSFSPPVTGGDHVSFLVVTRWVAATTAEPPPLPPLAGRKGTRPPSFPHSMTNLFFLPLWSTNWGGRQSSLLFLFLFSAAGPVIPTRRAPGSTPPPPFPLQLPMVPRPFFSFPFGRGSVVENFQDLSPLFFFFPPRRTSPLLSEVSARTTGLHPRSSAPVFFFLGRSTPISFFKYPRPLFFSPGT